MKQYLLIDIGGTFIKYSLADEQARKISGGKVPTPLTNMDDLLAAIEGFAAPLQGQFVGCAISMPGRIDTRNGIAIPVECSVPLCGSSPLLRRWRHGWACR